MNADSAPRTLAGYTVRGEAPCWSLGPLDQRPISELMARVGAVLAFAEVRAVSWTAFTPDCPDLNIYRYRVDDPGFQLSDGSLLTYLDFTNLPQLYLPRPLRQAIVEFGSALVDGHHTIAMLENFGVCVEVTITEAAIEITEHDPDF
ncbi:hypothetical protein ACIGO9_28930 [Nocardia asteroides]|uniref:hypothetical protein n=1 Tax=Nocardia asteroides TaxID=1824 RepID=UPI0037CAB50A